MCKQQPTDHIALPPKVGWVGLDFGLPGEKYLGGGRYLGGGGKIRQIRGRALTDGGPAPPHNLQTADLGR